MSSVTKQFILAGKATFTIEVPESFRTEKPDLELKPHYTFRVEHKAANGQYKEAWFAKLLTGPDNTRNYSYVGILNVDNGQVRTTAKSKLSSDSIVLKLLNRTLALVWAGDIGPMEAQGFALHHEGRCGKCGRLLTTPTSVEIGIGPECLIQMNGGHYPHLPVKGELPTGEDSGEDEPDGEYEADIAERQAVAEAYRRLANGDVS
jgi:hypothetical protein